MAFWVPRKASLLCRNRHMMTHTGLKPWKCPTCGKGFQQKIHVEVILVSLLLWTVKSSNSTSYILKPQDDAQNDHIANNISFSFRVSGAFVLRAFCYFTIYVLCMQERVYSTGCTEAASPDSHR